MEYRRQGVEVGYPGGPEATGSSNGVTVTPQELVAAGATIEGLSVSINASNSAVRSIVEQTAEAWVGKAGKSFQDVMAQWDTSAQKMRSALEQISADIKTNGHGYSDADDDNVSAVNQVAGSLNSGLSSFK
ncbi:hypothetical protein CH251_03115 [Rhodococcus sp. 06-462-5]|nr:hypothetical protein CH251_03115 [Rhodococcus sp. 06-462-5]OZE61980.1 hypothetical protein CH270_20060 [Rhodococcus sp. 02-925g]RMB76482.1 WXG100 family type VII secretion target [Rhodococcus sp. SBT000017]